MSINSNDPFDNPNANQGQAQPTYGQDDFAQTPPKKSRKGLWIGCGLALILGGLLCCGGPLLLIPFAQSAIGDLARAEVEHSPVVIEHIGEIESMSMDFMASVEEAQNVQPGQGSTLVFDVEGSKGSGQIIVQQSGGSEEIDAAVLVTSSGERFPIELASRPASEFEDIEAELNNLEFDDPIGTE